MITTILLTLLGYLFGSVSAAIVVCRLMRLPDPRTEGSGNPGATNVLRVGGKKAAAITLLGDLLKGTIPVLIARAITDDPATLALVGAAAFFGHLYPVFFGFQGGKGVATGLGVLLGWHWAAFLLTVLTWLVVARLGKISSLAALTAFLLAPLYVWLLTGAPELVTATAVLTASTFWRHRSNISKILAGTESRIGQKS
ncbi:MAG TPA: glycerol-3-phosphate 1-O-acyltransferase PlsY [Gammaproteobacteria bacterium]|nr:glycerol-3-phosphate 1-O-acyltransferase PlsY [Gammaproteobacteria bacterium]